MKYFYYAFARFQDILDARKLLEEVKFPELHGKTCRALPYDKDLLRSVQAEGNIFVKGFGDQWTHKELHEAFKAFGDIVSARVSIEEGHKSRGFGYVQYRKPESAVEAVEQVSTVCISSSDFELTQICDFFADEQQEVRRAELRADCSPVQDSARAWLIGGRKLDFDHSTFPQEVQQSLC